MILAILLIFLFSFILIIISLRVYIRKYTRRCETFVDCSGKVIVITGANTGIGFEAAKDLASRGAKVILACHRIESGEIAANDIRTLTNNNTVEAKECDLANFNSIRLFSSYILSTQNRLDVLICNAGTGSYYGRHLTCDNIELQFQTNHLGHFLLVHLLLDLLKATSSSRIVITSSLAHRFGKIDVDNIVRFDKYINHPFLTYCDTKLANVMFMKELSRRLNDTNITVNALNPGTIYTNGIKYNKIWYIKAFLLFLCFIYNRTAEEGAQTIIYLAISDQVKGVTGAYFTDCRKTNYNPKADDRDLSIKLWEISESLCFLDKFS